MLFSVNSPKAMRGIFEKKSNFEITQVVEVDAIMTLWKTSSGVHQ
jgi:hypothetical protein